MARRVAGAREADCPASTNDAYSPAVVTAHPLRGRSHPVYLELRELIQEITERAGDGETKRTSYWQIAASDLVNRDLASAARLRRLVGRWNKNSKLHPKDAALGKVVRCVVDAEKLDRPSG
jgi:hypothetical protein